MRDLLIARSCTRQANVRAHRPTMLIDTHNRSWRTMRAVAWAHLAGCSDQSLQEDLFGEKPLENQLDEPTAATPKLVFGSKEDGRPLRKQGTPRTPDMFTQVQARCA